MELAGRHVIVTGGSRGIGVGLSERFAAAEAPRRGTEWQLTGIDHQQRP